MTRSQYYGPAAGPGMVGLMTRATAVKGRRVQARTVTHCRLRLRPAGPRRGMAQHRGDSEAAPGCPLSVRSVDGVRPGCYAAAESESESKGLVRTSLRSDYQGPSHPDSPLHLTYYCLMIGYYNIFSTFPY